MAKKNDSTTKPATPNAAAPAAPPSPANPAPMKRGVKPAAKAKPRVKTKAPSVKAGRTSKPKAAATSATPAYTREDIALRAYFISENRRAHGQPGDEHQDWIEAERQLRAESSKAKKAKKA